MSDASITTEPKKRAHQFWFILAISIFLTATFVFYLPLRFKSVLRDDQHDNMLEMMDEQMMEKGMMERGMMEDDHGDDGHAALYNEENEVKEGLVVNFNVFDVPLWAGRPLFFNFWVNEAPDRIPVGLDRLEVDNTALMHVIGVRSDMDGFFHIHPEADTGSVQNNHLMTTHQLELPGKYKIWSEIKKDGVNHIFGHPEIEVGGDGLAENKKVSFARNVIVGSYQFSLFVKEPVSKGREQHLSFDLHALTGKEVGTENYLGAPMHLTIIKDDWSQFIHTHPRMGRSDDHSFWFAKIAQAHGGTEDEDSTADEMVEFDVVFPEAGLYKIFAQFRPEGSNLPEGEALLAAFWIEVQEKASSATSPQIWLTLISVILMAILSLAVRNYLKVKPAK